MASSIDLAINLIARDLTGNSLFGFGQVLDNIAQSMLGAGANASQLGAQTLTLAGQIGVAYGAFQLFSGILGDAASAASDLEWSLTQVELATQTQADATPVLTEAINKMAVDTVYSSQEAADAFTRLSESGFNAGQILYGLQAPADAYKQHAFDAAQATQGLGYQALVLGQALGSTATEGAYLLGAALHVFSGDGMTAAQAANLLAGAFYNGVPSAANLTQAIQQGGAAASVAGIHMSDYLTVLDMLAQSGMSASSAGASLNYVIRSLSEPTTAQAKAFAELGLIVENTTNPALHNLEQAVIKAGGASADQISLWHGSATGLKDLFDAAQSVGVIPLDRTFASWAVQTGLLKDAFYNADGTMKPLKQAFDDLNKAMSGWTPQEKLTELEQLFNIKSGRAGAILTNIQGFDQEYEQIFQRMGNTDVTANAQKQLDTFKGASEAFKDSLKSAGAVAIQPFLDMLTPLLTGMNNLLSDFMTAPQPIKDFVGALLIMLPLVSAVALGVLAWAGASALLTAAGIALGPILLGVSAAAGAIALVATGAALGIAAIKDHAKDLQPFLKPISDGLGAIHDAADNLKTKINNDVLPALGNFKDTLKDVADKGVDALKSHLHDLGTEIHNDAQSWPSEFKGIGDALGQLGDTFQSWGPKIGPWLGPALQQAGNVVKIGAEGIASTLGNIIGGAIQNVGSTLGQLPSLFGNALKGVLGVVQFATAPILGVFGTFGDILTNHWSQVGGDLQRVAFQMWQGIQTAFSGATGIVWNIFSGFIGQILGQSIALPGRLMSIFDPLVDKLPQPFREGWHNVENFFLSAPDNIVKELQNLPNQLFDLGKQAIQGLINGIKSMWSGLTSTISNLGGAISGGIGGALGGLGNLVHGALGFATGGTVPANGLYWVGERGPELMALPQGAHIFNNPDSMMLANGLNNYSSVVPAGDTGGTTHLTVYLGNDVLIDTFMDSMGGQLRVAGMNRLGH